MKSVWDYVMVVCNGGLLSKWYFLELRLFLSLSIRALIFQNGCLHAVLLLIQLTIFSTKSKSQDKLVQNCELARILQAYNLMQCIIDHARSYLCTPRGECREYAEGNKCECAYAESPRGCVSVCVCVYGLT